MLIGRHKHSLRRKFDESRHVRWLILLGVAAAFTLVLYPHLIGIRHTYRLGEVAERDIKAPKEFLIEDQSATEAQRARAVQEVLTVYDHDPQLAENIGLRVQTAFSELRARIHPAPSLMPADPSHAANATPPKVEEASSNRHERIWQMKAEFEAQIGIPVSHGAYKLLDEDDFSNETAYLIARILSEVMATGVVNNKEILLRESQPGIVLRKVGTKQEQVVRNLTQFFDLDQAGAMARIVAQRYLKDFGYNLRNLIIDFVQRLLQPNITLNRNETQERKAEAAAAVKPVMYQIKAGEMLLREGERVTEFKLRLLEAVQSEARQSQVWASSVGAALLLLCLMMTSYLLIINPQERLAPNHNQNLLFIGCVLVVFFLLAQVAVSLSKAFTENTSLVVSASSIFFSIPMASAAMVICLFLGLEVAIPFALVMAVSVTVILHNRFEFFIYFLLNALLAAYWLRDCRERKVFIKAGLKLALLNLCLIGAIKVYMAEFALLPLIRDGAFGLLGGIMAGIITAGLAPFVETVFGYTTDIKLLELANLDQPLLRRLMIEAPGSYHHSVIVGSLVEAAAAAIGANPLLAKVCGYYHDIGKIRKPLYFVENQTDGKNRHDKLAPSMSSLILLSHIKDGVELSRKHKLGQVIIDTIQQHHGTSLIKYFYDKAKQQKGAQAVNIDDYRYPGPKPQTREIALVMLADVVEAASRTLENPTPARIQGLVQRLINNIFSDGQLDECELTLKDLHQIARSFNKILGAIYHHRIEYPEMLSRTEARPKRKTKNGSADRQPAKAASDTADQAKGRSEGNLKRLGLS
jgi:putative nucleotidyltransferase with HDIG domain